MQDGTIVIIQQPDTQRTKPNGPGTIVLWNQPNRLAFEGLAEVDPVALPLDLRVGTDLSDCHPDSVLRGSYPTRVRPRRRMILAVGGLLSQGLMWPLSVVEVWRKVSKTLCCLRLVARGGLAVSAFSVR